MKLNEYTTLGRTGLRVSPLCLGAMGFGTGWGWGADPKQSFEMLDLYVQGGGNFIDTANGYQMGQSEQIVGQYVADHKLRDKAVIATKFTFGVEPGNPNAGGNGRKNIYTAVEASLRRLATDYIDVYYLHAWDMITPVEEVVSTLTDLVREGKIRYYGLSDTPAWYFTRAETLAEKDGLERCATLQLEYSLAERNIEREHIPAAQELGIGLCPWSPLAGGLLSGKYRRQGATGVGEGRLTLPNPIFNKFTERNWKVLEVLLEVSRKIGRAPAQVALNWLATQPGVTSIILGATKSSQLAENLACLDFLIPADLRRQLDDVGKPEPVHPYNFYEPWMQARISGNTTVREWRRSYLYEGAIAPPVEKKASAD
ncbi:MAG TPA: aldo/keto reductase [Candidatus Acidoferrum sp.]|jgi:aryl-alcohol dehydrogenase-like predicted oxidoreductase|nr:aldo/keto reductase [Candidatus Acidoferrum sp.]